MIGMWIDSPLSVIFGILFLLFLLWIFLTSLGNYFKTKKKIYLLPLVILITWVVYNYLDH